MTTQVHNQSLLEPGTSRLGCGRLLDGQATNPHAVVANDDHRPRIEVHLELIEVLQKERRLPVGTSGHGASEQDDARQVRARSGDQFSEVRVQRDEYPAGSHRGVDDGGIRGASQAEIMKVDHVVPRSKERLFHERRDALVEQELQAPRRSGSSRSRTASAAYSSASWMSSASRYG